MRPPEEVYPRRKAPQFDILGKPFHCFFYTGMPHFYELHHELYENLLKLNEHEDKMIRSGVSNPPPEACVDLGGSEWITWPALQSKLLEHHIKEYQYKYLIQAMERLAHHPYSARIKDFFMRYRRELIAVTSQMEVTPLTYDEDGRPFATAEG